MSHICQYLTFETSKQIYFSASLPLKQHKYNVTYENGLLFLLIWRETLLAIFQVLSVPNVKERSWIVNHMPCESRIFNLHVGKTEREARFHCSLLNIILPPESWRVLAAVHEACHLCSKEYGVLQEPGDPVGSWPLQYPYQNLPVHWGI